MRSEILKRLNEIQEEHGVRVFYACESGSRAWGFPSRDSDWDVRFLYAHERDWYLSVSQKRDVIEDFEKGGLDAAGWDLKKSLVLLERSNATLLEWLRSPIVYVNWEPAMALFKGMAEKAFSPKKSFHHYLAIAKRYQEEYQTGEHARLKAYMYVARGVLCCLWIIRYGSQPPMAIRDLLDPLLPGGETRAALEAIMEKKLHETESATMPRSAAFEDHWRGQMESMESIRLENPKEIASEDVDAVFRNILSLR